MDGVNNTYNTELLNKCKVLSILFTLKRYLNPLLTYRKEIIFILYLRNPKT